MEEPQISQILSRLRACYRTLNCQFFFYHKVHKEAQRTQRGIG